MKVLLMRFDAPLMSFGAPIVDHHGVIQPYPALSMIVGLLGNALGYGHADFALLQALQERLSYATRQDRRGEQLRDYHTVDLGQPSLRDDRAWTTAGTLERRRGGTASTRTHIRLRDYWAGSIHTVALTLDPPGQRPTIDELTDALQYPERPLSIGRKTCLPAGPLYLGIVEADSLVAALCEAPLADGADERAAYRSWWPSGPDVSDDQEPRAELRRPVTDARDWSNQIHVGERWIAEGSLRVRSVRESDADARA